MSVPQILAREDMKRSGRIQERRRARSKLGPHYSELFDEVADLLDQERSTSRTVSVTQQALPVVGEEQTQQPSSASMETPGRAIDECAGCHEEVKRNLTIDAVDQRRATLAQAESCLAQGRFGEVRSSCRHAAFSLLSSGSKVARCKLDKGVGSPGH